MLRVVVITIMVQTALFAVRPMVSYRALDLGADPFELGIITGSFSLLSLFLAMPIGRRVDVDGEAPYIAGGAALVAVACLCLAVSGSVAALAICQAFLGVAHVMNVVGIQSLIAAGSADAQRDHRFGAFTTAVSLGQLLGPAFVGGLAYFGGVSAGATQISIVFVSGAALSLAAAGLTRSLDWRRRARETGGPAERGSTRGLLFGLVSIPSMPQAILVSTTVLSTVEILTMYLPAYGESHGLAVEEVTLLLSVRAAASLASRLLMTQLITFIGRRSLLVVSTVAPGLLLFFWPHVDSSLFLYASMVVIGFGLGLGQPITLAWVAGRAPKDATGAALGLRLTANRLAQMSVPVGVGAVAGGFGIGSIFVSMTVLLGVSSLAAGTSNLNADPPPAVPE